MNRRGQLSTGRLGNYTALVGAAALTVVVATALAVRAASAQGAPVSLTIDVGDCLNLKSPGERFDCYERHVEAAKAANRPAASAAPPPSVAPVTAPVPTAAATAPTASAQPPQARASAPASTASPTAPPAVASTGTASSATDTEGFPQRSSPPPPDIVATVTELHETVPNAWLITLDNGQVWRQNIPQRFALKPGQRVTLHGTKWGSSFRLSADALNGFIQVERVR